MASPQWLISPLLPVPHGFTLRTGGVSEGPFSSLNLGFSVGDVKDRVVENYRRLSDATKISAFRTIHQVHGDVVLKASETGNEVQGECLEEREADALWTDVSGEAVAVRTADCVPILIADIRAHRVMAVHSGWRGTDLRICAKAVEGLLDVGNSLKDLRVAIGPSIRACCYQVGSDLGERFREKFGPRVAFVEKDHWRLDLATAVRDTLCEVGVPLNQIDLLSPCTACDKERFFSHRRDAGRTGRHLSFVCCVF